MFFTLLGIVTEVRAIQTRNASFPMPVTLLGIVTEVRPIQYSNVICIDSICGIRRQYPDFGGYD